MLGIKSVSAFFSISSKGSSYRRNSVDKDGSIMYVRR